MESYGSRTTRLWPMADGLDEIRGFHIETRDEQSGRFELRGYESTADEYTVFLNGEEILHSINGVESHPMSADQKDVDIAFEMILNHELSLEVSE